MEISGRSIAALFAASIAASAAMKAGNAAENQPDEDAYPAEVVDVPAANVLHVRVHPWVAQFAMASVCVEGKVREPKPCHYEAAVANADGGAGTGFSAGQKVLLRGLRPAEGRIAAHEVTADIPDMRPRHDVVEGPVPATVTKLIDGDTVQVLVKIFPRHYLVTDIRIGGIDTPEKRSKCATEDGKTHEKTKAARASEATRKLVEGRNVLLYGIQFEKYGGRVLGDVRTETGVSAAQNLIDKGLAKPYDGGTKSSWCGPR